MCLVLLINEYCTCESVGPGVLSSLEKVHYPFLPRPRYPVLSTTDILYFLPQSSILLPNTLSFLSQVSCPFCQRYPVLPAADSYPTAKYPVLPLTGILSFLPLISCLYSQTSLFRAIRSRDHDVVLVRRTIDLRCWEFGMGRGWEGGGQFTSNLGPRWTGSHHAKGGFPSK
jgi:hypothetical protein